MSSMSSMTAYWAERPFADISAYTLSSAPVWLQEPYQVLFHSLLVQRLQQAATDRLPLRRVVDLGCGPGEFTVRCLELSRRVCGVDVNPDFISRARQATAGIAEAEFVEQNLLEFDDFEDCDLVCLGGCVQCLTDAELIRLLTTLSDRLHPGALVYLRSTTTNPFVRPFRTPTARYRSRAQYEALFSLFRLQTRDSFHSSMLVFTKLLHFLLAGHKMKHRRIIRIPAALQLLEGLCTTVTRPLSWLSSRIERHNWILQKT